MPDDGALFELFEFDETRPVDVMDCGHSRHNLEHYEVCLKRTCPLCHLEEHNAYALWSQHDPEWRASIGEPCVQQSWHWERVACCLGCNSWTFGKSPCRNGACAFSDPDAPADPALWQPHPTVQEWWYPHPYWPASEVASA